MIGQADRVAELTRMQRSGVAGSSPIPIIGFFSGKGGTGKTFLAQQAAYAQAQLGNSVLLIDADFQNPNLHIMNNTYPEKTIADVLRGRALFSEIVETVAPNMHCAYGSIEGQSEVDGTDILGLVGSALRMNSFNAIIIDASAGINEDLIRQTTMQVIVANPEPTSVMDGYVVAKAIAQVQQNSKRVVVINKCHSFDEGNRAFGNLNKAMQHFLRETLPLLGLVPQHPDIYDSIMNQRIFLEEKSASPVAVHIHKVLGEELRRIALYGA